MPKADVDLTPASTNGKDPDVRILPYQITIQVEFAVVDPSGLEPVAKPLQFTIPGKVWDADWATPRSRELFANIVQQLQDAAAGTS